MAITTNIPGLSLAQELQALKKQQLSNLIASGVQPQDAETLSNGDGDFLNRFSKLETWGYPVGRRATNLGLGFINTFDRNILNWTGSTLLALGLGSEALLGGESYLRKAGDKLLDLDQDLDKAVEKTFYELNDNNPTANDEAWRGSGTSLGFATTGLLAFFAGLGNGISSPVAMTLASLAKNAHESLSEAGNTVSDLYAIDKSRAGDALLGGIYSLGGNMFGDFVQGGAEHVGKTIATGVAKKVAPMLPGLPFLNNPVANLAKYYLGGLAEQELNELFQEPRQQGTEQAVKNTFQSGDMSLKNFLSNYVKEMKSYPEYFKQTAPSVAHSTFITHNFTFPLGVAGAYHANRKLKQRIQEQLETNSTTLFPEDETNSPNGTQDTDTTQTPEQPDTPSTPPNAPSDSTRTSGTTTDVFDDRSMFDDLNDAPTNEPTAPTLPPVGKKTAEEISREQDERLDKVQEGINRLKKDIADANAELDRQGTIPFEETGTQSATNTEGTLPPSSTSAAQGQGSNTTRIRTMKGTEVDVRYRIVDADDLITSTQDTGKLNPAYPQELQPRQRNRFASDSQVNRIASNLDPELLGANRMASDGAPVIGSDMAVESGNGRVMGIRKAYRMGKAEGYRAWLKNNASSFGLTANDVNRVSNPVLVREKTSDIDRVQFSSEANESSIASMSATEHAIDDAKKLTPELLTHYDMEHSLEANSSFNSAFIGRLPANERGGLIQSNGRISQAGLVRVRNALAAKAYNDTSILNRLGELYDDDIKNVSNALVQAAPKMAIFETSDRRGEISIQDDIVKAVNLLADLKERGTRVSEYIAQPPLFSDAGLSGTTTKLLEFFDKNKRSAKRIASMLTRYAELGMYEAGTHQGTLFEDAMRSKESLLNEAINYAENLETGSESETYHQSNTEGETYKHEAEAQPNTDNQRAQTEGHKLRVEHDGRTYEFTVHVGEFGDKHPNQKKVFGRYLEIRDSEGNIVARYSPSRGKMEARWSSKYQGSGISSSIINALFGNEAVFKDNGFLDKKGNLKEGTDEAKEIYLFRRALAEGAKKARKKKNSKFSKAKEAFSRRVEEFRDRATGQEEKNLRAKIKQAILDLNHAEYGEEVSEHLSRIIARAATRFASYAGMTPEEYLADRGFVLRYDDNPEAIYVHDEKTGDRTSTHRGDITYEFKPRDKSNNILREANNIIEIFNTADASTVVHELGHFFLNDLRDLFRAGKLEGRAKQDWDTLIKWFGVEDIDLTKNKAEMTKEEQARWTDAQEKFAVGFEKYIMTNKAPTSKLKRAFEAFRRWMYDAYRLVRTDNVDKWIRYVGSDGKEHQFKVPHKVRKVMDRMFTDLDKKEARRAEQGETRAWTNGESKSNMQNDTDETASREGDSESDEGIAQTLSEEADAWRDNVDKVLDGAINEREHIKVMTTPRVFELIGAKALPVYMDAGKILRIFNKHPAITPDIIKQIPEAISDPIAIFKSATHPDDSIVVMTEIIDRDGGTVIVPVQLDVRQDSYQINRIASIYARKDDKTGRVHNDWFVKQVQDGNLIYVNNKKSSQWSDQTGLQLPVGSSSENLRYSIPDERDLARLNAEETSRVNGDSTETYSQPLSSWDAVEAWVKAGSPGGKKGDEFFANFYAQHPEARPAEQSNTQTSQTAASLNDILNDFSTGKLSREARRQMKEVHKRYKGTEYWLKAPNGKDTNLTAKQWLAVRTENFKRWFGDWENDPDNASKVLDENGEPRVVYHGTPNGGFSVFDTRGEGMSHDTGAWFTSRRENAETYTGGDYDEGVYPVFINIRNPYIIDGAGRNWNELGDREIHIIDNETGNVIYTNDEGEPFALEDEAEDYMLAKVDDGTYTVDENEYPYMPDPDTGLGTIYGRFVVEVQEDNEYSHTNDIVRGVFEGELTAEDHDGVIFKDIYDSGASFTHYLSDVYVVRNDTGIKSSTQNNGNYSASDRDIYHQSAPEISKPDLRIKGKPEGFISNADIERYNQRTYHATGHIVKDNQLSTDYAFTGGGWHARGFGIYTSALKSSAEPYRRHGLSKSDTAEHVYEFTLKDGRKVRNDNTSLHWSDGSQTFDADTPEGSLWSYLFKTLEQSEHNDPASNLRIALEGYINGLKGDIENYRAALDRLKDAPDTSRYRIRRNSAEQLLRQAQERLDYAQANAPVYAEYIKPKKGNIYAVESPEDYQLLDWDKDIHENSKQVQNILRAVIKNFDRVHMTGGELYRFIAGRMGTDKKKAERKASMWLMKQGIPGLMYLDKDSRENGGDTHNYVTWDTNLLHLLDVEGDAEAVEYFRNYKAEHPDGFITMDAVERLEQLVNHATGNIILGNRFDLRYVGSSEGGAAFGHGAYFGQSRAVAEMYRTMGLDAEDLAKLHVYTNDGQDISMDNIYRPDNERLADVALDIIRYVNYAPTKTIDEVKTILAKGYKNRIEYIRNKINEAVSPLIKQAYRDEIRASNRRLKVLDDIKGFEFLGGKRGNIYQFDIPEDYELMDWDLPLSQQPEQVRHGIDDLVDDLKRRGYSEAQILGIPEHVTLGAIETSDMDEADITGGALYQNVVNLLGEQDNDAEAMVKASELFNEHGIPGHRYWDRGSRDKQTGTHNFVIWNMRRVQMVGIDPTSDREAIDYYNRTKRLRDGLAAASAESYHQTLQRDAQAWSDTVDRFMNGEIKRRTDGNMLHVMDTPPVFTLAGMERLPIEIRLDNMHKILLRKHHLSPETLKQVPQALADPVMIFKSEHDTSRNRDSRVVLTELREKDNSGVERSIVAAITLGKNNLSKGYAINELTTVYKKDTSTKQNLTPEEDIYDWITRTFKDGTPMNLLLYVNKEKARQGAISSGLKPMVFDTLKGLPDSIPNEHDLARLDDGDTETYHQIGRSRKQAMDAELAKYRPDLTAEQRAEAIAEIEKLGETVRHGGYPKLEKAATHWLLNGHIVLPEDNYKITSALEICEQEHLDYQAFDDPNKILAKYTIKETKASRRINPDTVPEFSNKVAYDGGITIYTVKDTREGQQAVRRIIDTHWGEDANPWCLAARQDNSLDTAWRMWEHYSGTDKRIAFQDGKLLAFSASDGDEATWWDREDEPSEALSYTLKDKDKTTEYILNEKTGKQQKLREVLANGTKHEWNNNGQLRIAQLPDGTDYRCGELGQLQDLTLPDGANYSWNARGWLQYASLPNGAKYWLEDYGKFRLIVMPNGAEYHYSSYGGGLESASLPDGVRYKWGYGGVLRSVSLSDNSHYYWHDNGKLSSAYMSDGTSFEWNDSGKLEFVNLPDGSEYSRYTFRTIPKKLRQELMQGRRSVKQNVMQIMSEAEHLKADQEKIQQDITQEAARVKARYEQYSSDTESYHQIIGIGGARRLDEAEGVTTRMDNLKIAKRMMREGQPVNTMWLATGWMKGKEGRWRYEIPDGRIINRLRYTKEAYDEYKRLSEKAKADDYLEHERVDEEARRSMSDEEYIAYRQENTSLDDVDEYDYSKLTPEELRRLRELEDILDGVSLPDAFDAPELFDAYPELRAIRYIELDLGQDVSGTYQPETKTIVINSAMDDRMARDTIIHEMQHVIQGIEGFGQGSTWKWDIDPIRLRLLKRAERLLASVDDADLKAEWREAIDALDRDKVEALVKRAADDKQRKTFGKLKDTYEAIDKRYDKVYYRYARHAGETEARNAARRAELDNERRRAVPLDRSEDISRDEQVIGRIPKKSQAFEIYSQSVGNRQNEETGVTSDIFRRTLKNTTPESIDITNLEKGNRGLLSDDFIDRFNQLAYVGTSSIILNNRYDLNFIGSGEGNTYYGWGAYLAENPSVSESYRKIGYKRQGLSADEIANLNGNLYIFDIPENDVLLDLNKTLAQQTEHVREAVSKIYSMGLLSEQDWNITGLDLYQKLTNLFLSQELDETEKAYLPLSNKWRYDKANQKKTSMLFNQLGVPGLCFFDKLSRGEQKGTRNFVIWNQDAMKMIGIDPSSTTEAIDYFERYKAEHPEDAPYTDNNLIAPRQIEHFDQLAYHGTDNIILGNMFDLRYAGSSEGGSAYGYGAYFAGNILTAQNYRHFGDPTEGAKRVVITTKDGRTLRSAGGYEWEYGTDTSGLRPAIDDLRFMAEGADNIDLERMKKNLLKLYKRELREQKHELSLVKKELKTDPHSDTRDRVELWQSIVNKTTDKINALDNISAIEVLPPKKGNVYTFDIPENYELLDWEARMPKQPEIVRKARKEIFAELKKLGLDTTEAREAKTGENFYWALMNIMDAAGEELEYPQKGITDPKQKASLILLKHGVPGLRYLDWGSRDAGKGTHNFVIWDTNKLKMLGVEGNPEAEQHFRETRAQQEGSTQTEAAASLSTDDLEQSLNITQEQIDSVRSKYEGTSQWLKAPNGNETNLSEKQWLQVRTDNFKAWFGDWESNPQDASKIIDENGEPLIVYHGTPSDSFSVFDIDKAGSHTGNIGRYGKGFYFSEFMSSAKDYTWNYNTRKYGNVIPAFLNIKHPFIWNETEARRMGYPNMSKRANRFIPTDREEISRFTETLKAYGYDGVIKQDFIKMARNEESERIAKDWMAEVVAFNPEQIKSATDNNGNFSTSDPDIFHQTANLEDTLSISEQQLEAVRRQYEGKPQWLKAPNGQRTNLTERQWLQVRTPAFKTWFGDWENDSEHASKVLDANGEPLVVWHGSRSNQPFSVFDVDGRDKTADTGAFFSDNRRVAEIYSDGGSSERLYPVFLNIRNPFTYDAKGKDWSELGEVWVYDSETGEEFNTKKDGSVFMNENDAYSYLMDTFGENEADNYEIFSDNEYNTTDEITRAVWNGDLGDGSHDGVIFTNINDNYDNGGSISSVFVTRTQENIKSATRNNGSFSASDPDIYHQSTLVTPERLEQYDQLVTHGTGHIIYNNRFDLRYIGSGEGGSMFGYGAYFGQNKAVAENYRRYGLKNTGFNGIEVTLSNGAVLSLRDIFAQLEALSNGSYPDLKLPRGVSQSSLADAIKELMHTKIDSSSWDFDKAINDLIRSLQKQARDIKQSRPSFAAEILNTVKALKKISSMEFIGEKRGNIYEFDIPEDEDLLNWDTSLDNQSDNVKKGIKKLYTALQRMGFSKEDINGKFASNGSIGTAADLYWAVARAMQSLIETKGYAQRGITNPEQAASMMFLKAGIPGHRYLDWGSRGTGNGTHNFVIWDESKITMTGIDPSSDEEARQVYENGGRPLEEAETYHQAHNSFLQPEQLERFEQLMYHGTKNILSGNRFDLRYLSTGEGAQAYGYGAYLAQDYEVARAYRTSGLSDVDRSSAVFIMKDGKAIAPSNLASSIHSKLFGLDKYTGKILQNYFNPSMLMSALTKSDANSQSEMMQAFETFIADMYKQAKERERYGYADYSFRQRMEQGLEKTLRDIVIPLLPVRVEARTPKNGNIYSIDGPEDYELLDWDTKMTEQSAQVLDKLKKAGLYVEDNETGKSLYKRISAQFGGGHNGDRLASMALNDAGIPGHRFWDAGSRHDKSGTHNFVIWNTDTLRLLGISEDSETEAQEYYRADDYSSARLDSLDNDSDIVDYSSRDYEMENDSAEDYYRASLDAREDDGFSETYHQAANGITENDSYTFYATYADGKQKMLRAKKSEIQEVRKQYEGTEQWLKAPNGKASNLNENAWLFVRTKTFKEWFGLTDWETTPKNSSRVVDENGEPLQVYYRGGGDNFSTFDTHEGAGTTPTFLNLYSPYILDASSSVWDSFEHPYRKGEFLSTSELVEAVEKGHIGRNMWEHYDGIILQGLEDSDGFILLSSFKPSKAKTDSSTRNIDESKDIDARYFEALDAGDMDTARAIIDEQARRKGYSKDDSFRMSHRAPVSSDNFGPNMAEVMTSGIVPDDYWTHPEYYLSTDEEWEAYREVVSALRRHQDNLEKGITTRIRVYRAVPSYVRENSFRNGDWVSPSLSYARLHGEAKGFRIISKSVPINHLWWDGNSIDEWGYDDNEHDYVYRNTKNNRKLNDTVTYDSKGEIVPASKRFNYRAEDVYHQAASLENNPLIERYSQLDTFGDEETEKRYSASYKKKSEQGAGAAIWQAVKEGFLGLSGDFPKLALDKEKRFTYTREVLRKMNRESEGTVMQAVRDLRQSIKGLDARQLNIFARTLLLRDINTFRRQNPHAPLPLAFTPQSLKAEWEKFAAMAQADAAISKAVRAEFDVNQALNNELAGLAEKLGLPKLADKVKRNNFYVLEYSRLIDGEDVNANYFEAVSDIRSQQLEDIIHMKAILKIKGEHDIKDKLIRQFGKNWRNHLPDGYKVFNPLTGHFIQSAHTLTENVLGVALEEIGRKIGLSDATMSLLRSSVADSSGSHLLVLPDALADTLDKMAVPKVRGWLGKIGKALTTTWKKLMLFFPTRAVKYNIRNVTGDLDAVMAGNPKALRYLPQAMKELWQLYYGNGEATPELREFQNRGGAITIQTTQMLGDDKQLREFYKLMDELKGKKAGDWAALPRSTWRLIDKFAWSGIQNFSDFREQWLRYACYLEYIHQMEGNDEHMPGNWGASVKEEVLSIPAADKEGIRDRAFKMSNELLGAYDQVSETGQSLRDILIPFYSWMEVNAKRYYQLLKNGIAEDNFGSVATKLLKGQLANVPYYGFKVAKTYFFINLLSMLIAAFNRLVWPEDEDKLPPDTQARTHITLGHNKKGNVLYFDRVGALLDNLEWFGQDDSPFAPFAKDVKEIFDGRQTFTGFVGKLITSPINKIVSGINPLVKTPFELMAGKSLYPDFTHPRNIQDGWQYLAQSFGLNWPYKAITGKPVDNWKEFKGLFMYQADAEEAAYFYTLDLVREYQEKVLGKRSGGFGITPRGQVLRDLKTALRLGNTDDVQKYLQKYYRLGGDQKGLKSSMRNMNPLHGLSKSEQAGFLKWISPEDKKYINRANAFFHRMADRFLK